MAFYSGVQNVSNSSKYSFYFSGYTKSMYQNMKQKPYKFSTYVRFYGQFKAFRKPSWL